MNTCDIIIPTYNNVATLPHVVAAINSQIIPNDWAVRVLICDDGSEEDSVAKIQNTKYKIPTLVLGGRHKGAAAARNRGIKASKSDVIFFLGADIILRPGALAAHLIFHEQHPEDTAGALGFVVWDPRLRPTPLMEWMTHGGPQNNFDDLLGSPTKIPFFGSHVSIKRSQLSHERFSEEYTEYGWEDIEFGYRLHKQGLKLYILEQAVGLHHHFYSADDIFRRQASVGRGAPIFRRHTGQESPALSLSFQHRIQVVLYAVGAGALLRMFVRYLAPRYAIPRLFAHMANYEYRRGLFHTEHTSYPQVFPQ